MPSMAKVLLIDDDRKHSELLKNYLKQFGISLECAGDADEGMRKLSRAQVEFLVTQLSHQSHFEIIAPNRSNFQLFSRAYARRIA